MTTKLPPDYRAANRIIEAVAAWSGKSPAAVLERRHYPDPEHDAVAWLAFKLRNRSMDTVAKVLSVRRETLYRAAHRVDGRMATDPVLSYSLHTLLTSLRGQKGATT